MDKERIIMPLMLHAKHPGTIQTLIGYNRSH